jgi:hypothetical protein
MALACFLTYRWVRDMVHSFVSFVSSMTFELRIDTLNRKLLEQQ